ncbi:hypothetical protein [Rhodococcus qingshengii]|uniref:hypothetical protein n=1 Tax=Rhodococcus qingshengii TaxID=334542 RepID=UPI001ADF77C7|nr:hypothetical protein [Rhodococcus qingshengii]MCQ4148652.1 hypothetical protein [Rhodococcus qingshengii]
MDRRLECKGDKYEIRYAICRDGKSPAVDFLDELAQGAWQEGLDAGDGKLDQTFAADTFKALMKRYARRGELGGKHQINGLGRGIWEFKVGTKRLSFFDTDGTGGYVERETYRDRDKADRPESKIWHIPDLDSHIRLADGFPKRGQTTPSRPINWAHRIRREDTNHDTN